MHADRPLVKLAGLLMLAAAALHAAAIEEHLVEWWGYGAFFIACSIAQGLLGFILLALPANVTWDADAWTTWRRRLFAVGIVGNLAVIVLYAVTRTVGIPLFGPEAGVVEAVDAFGLATKAVEAAAVLCLLWLVRHLPRDTRAVPAFA